MDSGEVRARQRKARERLCRTAIAYARRFLQSYRDRRRGRTRATATGTVQDAAVCHGSVSLGTGPSVERTWLRNRARREQPAGNQRLQQRIFGGIESPPPADRGTSRKGKPARSRRGTGRRAPDTRRKARTLTRRDARQAQSNGRALRQSTRAGCQSGTGARRTITASTRRESHRPGRYLLPREKSGT